MSFSSHSGLDACIGIERDTMVLFDSIPHNNIKADEWKIMLDRVVVAGTLNQIRLKNDNIEGGVLGQDYNVLAYFTVSDYVCEDDIYSISIKLLSPEKLVSKIISEKIEKNEYDLCPYVMNMYNTNRDSLVCHLINYFILNLK